jgi:hypothetical protein
LNYGYFKFAFVGNGAHSEVFGTFYLVVLHICAYHLYELVAVALCLAHADAYYVGKLVGVDGVGCCHCLKRRVLENHVRRQVQPGGYFATQGVENGEQLGVGGARGTALHYGFFVWCLVGEICVFNNFE